MPPVYKSVAVVVVAAMLLCSLADADTFPVGGSAGWSLDMGGWPNGKTFNAGDIIVFNYNPAVHNVIIVTKEDYDACAPVGTKLNSGHDQVTLTSGTSYYICGTPGHCDAGQQVTVTAV
ncbi:unnamed protein product [Cuscuta epithymum]|uniref:Phytocyanin domain-containing protein n=1 Tax=Cuscuta epithymum TaxID=186058 RepID=A0AAV0G161_9ASTE|nr:unnamed protein product [Cuscuta epithymum]CAH9141690.1 unnamed protein product [Cuscuta epithymum]